MIAPACSDRKLLKMAGHGGNLHVMIYSANPQRATTELKQTKQTQA